MSRRRFNASPTLVRDPFGSAHAAAKGSCSIAPIYACHAWPCAAHFVVVCLGGCKVHALGACVTQLCTPSLPAAHGSCCKSSGQHARRHGAFAATHKRRRR